MKPTIATFGEILWNRIGPDRRLGGAPYHFARRVAALGRPVRVISRVGEDEAGRLALEEMRSAGLDPELVQRDRVHPTAESVGRGSEETRLEPPCDEAAFDFVQPSSKAVDWAASAVCFFFGTLAQRSSASRETLKGLLDVSSRSCLRFLNLSLRQGSELLEVISDSLARAEIAQLNLAEAHYVADLFELSCASLREFNEELMEQFPLKACVITLGAHGAFASANESEPVYVPGYEVSAEAPPPGCGDAFAAGFAHQRLNGATLEECCVFGNALGALAAQGKDFPAADEAKVRDFIAEERPRVRAPDLEAFATA